jgi:uncharacterized protein (TIGR02271 family)
LKTVVGLFDNFTQAQTAAQQLESAGIPHNDISFLASNASGQYDQYANTGTTTTDRPSAVGTDAAAGAVIGGGIGLLMGLGLFTIPGFGPIVAAGWLASTLTGAGIGAVAGGLIGALTSIGVPQEDAVYYNEAVRRGGTLLAVRAPDNMADRVAEILDNNGAVNVDERAEQYRQEGFLPTPNTAATAATRPAGNVAAAVQNQAPAVERPIATTPAMAQNVNAADREVALPVVEEEIQVGKRQVQRGGVRVYTHITETPVEENVQLREEHVTVDRHPVNRPVGEGELEAFREGTIEVTEVAEEPVIAKQARVVEEVVVGKEATQRTETVRDTVRRTDVEVEPISGEHVSRTANYDTWATDFRNNFNTTYANRGMTYEQFEPAYRYGYDLSADRRYSGRDWATIEPEIQRDWETRQPGTWSNVRGAVRYAWDKATGAERGGIKTGGHDIDGTPDTRGITEKVADAVTGDRIDDKTGKPVR